MLSSKLVIVEPYEHYEILERWLPVLATIHQNIACWVRVPSVEHDLRGVIEACPTASLDHPNSEQDFDEWLKQKLSGLSETDCVLWVTTGLRYDRLMHIPAVTPLMLVGHNLRSLLAPELGWPNRLKSIGTLVKYWLSGQAFYRRRLISRTPILLVPNTSLARQAAKLGYNEDKIKVWRFSDQSPSAPIQTNSKRRVVVPGTIRPRDRDYDTLFQVVSQSLSSFKTETKLIFLGHCRFKSFKRKWEQLAEQSSSLQVQFYDEPLRTQEYYSLMLGATVVVLPLKEQVYFGPFKEYLGSSKVSGGVYDAFAHNKPLLLPAFYSTDDLEGYLSIHNYSSPSDATQKLIHILGQPNHGIKSKTGISELRKQMHDTLSTILG